MAFASIAALLQKPRVRRWMYPGLLLLFVVIVIVLFALSVKFLLGNVNKALEIQSPETSATRTINEQQLRGVEEKLGIPPPPTSSSPPASPPTTTQTAPQP